MFVSLILLIVAVLLYFILPVSIPLIVALITALLLEPVVKILQTRFSVRHRISVLIVFLTFVIFFALAGYFLTTKVITEAIKIVGHGPIYINEITKEWMQAKKEFAAAAKDLPDYVVAEISNRIEGFLNNVKEDLIAYVNIDKVKSILTNIPNYLVSFLVYLIALFLFLIELPRLRAGFQKHLSNRTAEKVNFMTSRLSFVVFGFFKAQFLVSIIIFIVSLVALLMIAPKIALVMALIIWLIDFIPIIGSIVLLGPWSLLHLVTGDVALGTELAVLAAILLIIRRTLEPKVMGSHIGLSPLSTLIGMYLGLKIFGILGFIFGPLLLISFNTAKEAGIIKINFKL
jgi:sporulation integral membrane protein YtvI